ncbi:hypothetical protein BKA70DRAFT_1218337 [Coprinopsis sp. MPI-PUGE-AT-0042]|nr:hypothetical protein BKA70DRAFT_1218337 [Coprinopsis sp. MPI-PUGE-AT-0042]
MPVCSAFGLTFIPYSPEWSSAQVAATDCHSWKGLNGKPEAAWPPANEEALIEFLVLSSRKFHKIEHDPTTSRYGVQYSMRDQFISNYILKKTGKACTEKKVGSRLQQLQDTSKGNRQYKAEAPATSLLGNRELSSSPTPLLPESIVIHVQLECRSERQGVPTSTPQVRLKPNKADTPYFLYLTPISRYSSGSFPPACPTPPSTLSLFSITVKLVSPFPLSEETAWTAYKGHTRIHQERTAIRMLCPAAGRRAYLRPCPFTVAHTCESEGTQFSLMSSLDVPEQLSTDPNYITIVQKVRSAREASLLATAAHFASPTRAASIFYHFDVPDNAKFNLFSLPNHGSISQGGNYWPSTRQGSSTHRDTSRGHRRMHEEPLTGADNTHSHEPSPYSNPPINTPADPCCCEHNLSRTMEGTSIFSRCAKIEFDHCQITSVAVGARPPTETVSSHKWFNNRRRSPSSTVQEGGDPSPPPAIRSSASVTSQGHQAKTSPTAPSTAALERHPRNGGISRSLVTA